MRKKINIPIIPKFVYRRSSDAEELKKTIGQAPGTLIYTGKKQSDNITISLFSYNENELNEHHSQDLNECLSLVDHSKINWINVDGLSDVNLIKEIGNHFNLHPLLLEDILNVEQRPKFEEYESHLFFTIKMFQAGDNGRIDYEHLSFVLGKNIILSFQETKEDVFEIIRDRLRTSYGKIRMKKADYLFYRFVDIIVDNYYFVLDHFAVKIENLEDEVMENPSTPTLQKLQTIRKELIYLRRSVYPLRESLNGISKSETSLLVKETERFFDDVFDHSIHVIESLEIYRDLLSGIMDLYMNTVSQKMNEIMKVLTIMASIFIPLTFIAGIYGMNFEYIPELGYRNGYFAVWALMILIVIGMLYYFKRKQWL